MHEGCQKNFLTKNSYVFCAVVYFKRWKEDRITADQRGAREEVHGRVIEESGGKSAPKKGTPVKKNVAP